MSIPSHSTLTWWTSPRLWLRSILMLDDHPHSIALGAAIGMFIAMTPTVGIQMVIVVAVSFLLKPVLYFNRMAAIVAVYVSNPITLLPIYWLNYTVGTLFLPETVDRDQLASLLQPQAAPTWGAWFAGMFQTLWELVVEVGEPLIVGSLIVSAICAVLTYPFIRWLLNVVRPRAPVAGAHSERTADREKIAS